MDEIEFDRAFSEFLNEDLCEKSSEFVFEMIRTAFAAGWKAALGSDIGKTMNIDRE